MQGRGPKALDPYAGPESGAIRLALQVYNGCAIIPTGEPIAKNSVPIPYPDNCTWSQVPPSKAAPHDPMPLLTDTDYFIHQFTAMEAVKNLHNDPGDMASVMQWMRTQTYFRDLDWSGLSKVMDDWEPSYEWPNPNNFIHMVQFGNTNWLLKTDDTFLIEFLDADGQPRQSQTYDRKSFLSENATAGHTILAWEQLNLGPPRFMGDMEPQPVPPAAPGYLPSPPPQTLTYIRFDMVLSASAEKRFRIPETLAGEGAIRVTWSQLPKHPFHIPVRYMRSDEVAKTCYKDGDPNQRVACTFGVQPKVKLSTPKNGKFYVPGETAFYKLAVTDGAGNYLHPLDAFPTWYEYIQNKANGFTYSNTFHIFTMQEHDTSPVARVVGPLQDLNTFYEPTAPYFQSPAHEYNWISQFINADNVIPGGRNMHPPTTWSFTLPSNAKPGTYEVLWKVHRFFMGERFSKIEAFRFPVGQEELTTYPAQVGNCQICHRGILSLDNVRHGLSVDHVEACKGCHNRDLFPAGRHLSLERRIHEIHMNSPKYHMDKNNCSVCHLTKHSATRSSYHVCASCHPAPHGGHYDDLKFTPETEPGGVYGNCAAQCHETSLPSRHVYPTE